MTKNDHLMTISSFAHCQLLIKATKTETKLLTWFNIILLSHDNTPLYPLSAGACICSR